MNCLGYDELIDFSLKQLTPEKEASFLAHFSSCSLCRQELQTITVFGKAFNGYIETTEQQASVLLKQQTFAQLKQEVSLQPIRRLPHIRPFFFYAMTAAALLFVFGWSWKNLFFQKKVPSSIEQIQTSEAIVPMNEKEHLVLAQAFDSELHQMLASLEDMNIEAIDESDQLAEDYLNEVIFATFEEE